MEHLALTGDRLKRGFAEGSSLSFRRRSFGLFLCMINSFAYQLCKKKSEICFEGQRGRPPGWLVK